MTAPVWTRYESRALGVASWEAHKSLLLAGGWKFHDAFNDVVYIRRPMVATPVEVTQQMIDAGIAAYVAAGVLPTEFVPSIYRAMHLARPLSEGPTP
jgi:hypothetical protein